MGPEQQDLCGVPRDQMEDEEEQNRDSDQDRDRNQDSSSNELEQELLHRDVVEQRCGVHGELQTAKRLWPNELRVRVVERDDRSVAHDLLAELLISRCPFLRIAHPVGCVNLGIEGLVAVVSPVEAITDELTAEDRTE